jgi:cobalt-precorrin 5A hydrolase
LAAAYGANHRFDGLKKTVSDHFYDFSAHVFIMSTGIVVRMIAPLIRDKTRDPAVLVADEKGRYVISLLSGHIGGANALATEIAGLMGAHPVITTATDLHGVPAVDVLAVEKNLLIENPGAIKHVSQALISKKPIAVHDPYRLMTEELKEVAMLPWPGDGMPHDDPGLFVDDTRRHELPEKILVLRPPSLVAGIGCNRHTGVGEIRTFLFEVLDRFRLAPGSLNRLASIDLKADEAGLVALAEDLGLPIDFFARDALNSVTTIQNPSEVVEKHVGVKSVCEAAAILGAGQGQLIVPKQNTPNVTVAIARDLYISSASDRAVPTI